MPREITIRLLGPEDAPGVAALSGDLGYPTAAAEMAGRLAALLAVPGHVVFGAFSGGGTLLGWVHACLRLLLIDPPSAFIEGLVVDPGAQLQGVGRALMAAAEDWARAHGARVVRLRSGAPRTGAHAFYRALGYCEGKAALGFEKTLPSSD